MSQREAKLAESSLTESLSNGFDTQKKDGCCLVFRVYGSISSGKLSLASGDWLLQLALA